MADASAYISNRNKNIRKLFHIVELSFEFIIQSFININAKNQYLLV